MALRSMAPIVTHDDLYPSIPIAIIPTIKIMESPIGLSTNIKLNSSTIV